MNGDQIDQAVSRTRGSLLVVLVGFVLVMLGLAGAFVSRMMADQSGAQVVSVTAVPAKEVRGDIPAPVEIATKTVRAYKPATKRALKLPQAVQDDPAALVVSASAVQADDHPHTITTVVNGDTGEVTTFDRRDPLPWVAVNTHGRAGIYYGIKAGVQTVRIQAQQELVQVKALHLGLIGSVDQPLGAPVGVDYYAGVGVWMTW